MNTLHGDNRAILLPSHKIELVLLLIVPIFPIFLLTFMDINRHNAAIVDM